MLFWVYEDAFLFHFLAFLIEQLLSTGIVSWSPDLLWDWSSSGVEHHIGKHCVKLYSIYTKSCPFIMKVISSGAHLY